MWDWEIKRSSALSPDRVRRMIGGQPFLRRVNDITEKKHGTEGRDRSGKKSSLRTNWKGFSQDHQEHVGRDCAGGQAQGQGLHVGAGEERTPQERGLTGMTTH